MVDFDKVVGPVKSVNGVGQPPMIGALGGWMAVALDIIGIALLSC